MPTIYLSPSTQEYNLYEGGGNEEYYMNLIADAMIPYLNQYGIGYGRNTGEMTAGSSIRQSNAGNYDFHIAIHSNAAPPGKEGQVRGTVIFYYPSSTNGKRMADILQQNFKKIYPLPNLVNTMPTTTLGEVARTKAPAVLIEVAYHDNPEDRNWIKNNIDLIGRTIVQSAAQYFNLAPQTAPSGTGGRTGKVTLNSGYLNIRREPSLNAAVIDMAPNGATLTVLNTVGDWYQVTYKGKNGYAFSKYVKVQ